MNITIPVRYLQAISLFAAKNDPRYHLRGVAINNKHLVATDGSTLAALPVDAHEEDHVIMPIDAVVRFLKMLTTKEKKTLDCTITKYSMACELHYVAVGEIVGKFPDWQRIVPTIKTPIAHDYYDWSYMTKFQKASDILRGYTKSDVRLITNGHDAALVQFKATPEFIGALMPMRIK